MTEDEQRESKKYYIMWEDFKQKIICENRYFLKHEVLDCVYDIACNSKEKIKANTEFYRARKFVDNNYLNVEEMLNLEAIVARVSKIKDNDEFVKTISMMDFNNNKNEIKKGFWGYRKGQNLAPPKNVILPHGRANPQFIGYLYLVDSQYTALSEIKPTIGEKINISKIINIEEQNVADLTYNCINSNHKFLAYLIFEEFGQAYLGNETQYIPTQYITEYLKHNGFDGIKYNSSMNHGGKNYTFFDSTKFDDCESKVYQVENICFDAKCLNCNFEDNIIHKDLISSDMVFPTLKSKKEELKKKFIKILNNDD